MATRVTVTVLVSSSKATVRPVLGRGGNHCARVEKAVERRASHRALLIIQTASGRLADQKTATLRLADRGEYEKLATASAACRASGWVTSASPLR